MLTPPSAVSPLTEARTHIAELLRGPLKDAGVVLHPEPPEVPGGTCVVLVPGEPWATRKGLAGRWLVTVDITVLVPVAGGRSMLTRLEEVAALVAAQPGVPGKVRQAQKQTWANGEYYAAPIPMTVEITP